MFLQKGEAAMKIQPTLDEAKTTAAVGRYDVLPVSCEILADICTPIEALKILKNVSTHCYLLESAQPSEKWGRYTFLGLDPKMEITCRNGVMKAGKLTFETQNPSLCIFIEYNFTVCEEEMTAGHSLFAFCCKFWSSKCI